MVPFCGQFRSRGQIIIIDANHNTHETGTLEGKIIFQYEDSIGNTYITEEPFTMEVMEQEMPPMMDPDLT